MIARNVLGDEHYSDIWSIMMTANSLIGGGLYSSWSLFYDIGGSYKGTFIGGAALYALSVLVGFAAVNLSKKYKPAEVVESEK